MVTGFPVFLHTPCGRAPSAFCVPVGVVSTPGLRRIRRQIGNVVLAPLEHPLGGLYRPELFGSLGCAVWQHGLWENSCSPHT